MSEALDAVQRRYDGPFDVRVGLTDTHDWIPTSTEEAVAFDEWLERYNAAKALYDGLLEEGHDKGWWTEKGPRLLDGRWVRKVDA